MLSGANRRSALAVATRMLCATDIVNEDRIQLHFDLGSPLPSPHPNKALYDPLQFSSYFPLDSPLLGSYPKALSLES